MTLSPAIVEQVRRRASGSCEYCGVTEVDTGGFLTIDHYRPSSAGGNDDPENLVYSCFRCNNYKGDHWPDDSQPSLWNPRLEPADKHFRLQDDGSLEALSSHGLASLEVLHLNRPLLIAQRLRRRQQDVHDERLVHLEQTLTALRELRRRHAELVREEIEALQRIERLLTLLLQDRE